MLSSCVGPWGTIGVDGFGSRESSVVVGRTDRPQMDGQRCSVVDNGKNLGCLCSGLR